METAVKVSVIVYTKPNCVQCTATFKKLDELGIDYATVDLTEDNEALERLKERGYLQAPVVETGDSIWSGYRPDRVKALARSS